MWNSNPVISWVLERAGVIDTAGRPPRGGRGPVWDAGRTVARRSNVAEAVSTISDLKKPVILIIDPEGSASATAVKLMEGYARSYTVAVSAKAKKALEELRGLAHDGRDVALILADRASCGAGVLDSVRTLHPHARRGLLLGWNESRAHREEIAAAFARRDAECFVTKPGGTPDERFHRSITELLDEWWRLHGSPIVALRVIGAENSARVSEICEILQRSDFPYSFQAADSNAGRVALQETGATPDQLPSPVHQTAILTARSMNPPSQVCSRLATSAATPSNASRQQSEKAQCAFGSSTTISHERQSRGVDHGILYNVVHRARLPIALMASASGGDGIEVLVRGPRCRD